VGREGMRRDHIDCRRTGGTHKSKSDAIGPAKMCGMVHAAVRPACDAASMPAPFASNQIVRRAPLLLPGVRVTAARRATRATRDR
jgi:hypothetical protein